MDQVWENETEVIRELEDITRKVSYAQGSGDAKEIREEVRTCTDMLKSAAQLLRKQKVDIAYASKEHGVVDKAQQADLTARFHTPLQDKYNSLKEAVDALRAGRPPAVNPVPQPLTRPPAALSERSDDEDPPAYRMSPTEASLQSPDPPVIRGRSNREELFDTGASVDERDVEVTMTQQQAVAQVQDTAIEIQKNGLEALQNCEVTVAQTAEVGNDISAQLVKQHEDILLINDDMDNLNVQIKRARREVGQFSRRLATDKCFICLFILVLLFVVVLVALKIFNDPGDNSSSTEDASLEFVDDDTA